MNDFVTLAPKIAHGVPRLLRTLVSRAKRDHATIMRSAWRNDHGSRPAIFVNVAGAPSRRKAWNVDVPGVRAWVRDVFGGRFEFASDWVTATGVARFQATVGANERTQAQLVVWPTGLIEFTCPISSRALETGLEASLTDLADPIMWLVEEVRRGVYSRILSGRRPSGTRLDWFVGCSAGLADDAGSIPLRRLAFPDDVDCGRPEGREMTAIGQGTLTRRMISMKQSVRPDRLALTAIEDLLQNTGHYDYADALERLQDALGARTLR